MRINVPSRVYCLRMTACDGEHYLFRFTQDNYVELLRHFGRLASDQTNGFTWYDAAWASQFVRKTIW